MTTGNAQTAGKQWRAGRRTLRTLILLTALGVSVTEGLPLAFAQGIPSRQVPAIAPAPLPKVLAPARIPGTKYDCPAGYAKPDPLLQVQNVRICLPVGKLGFSSPGISANIAGSTATAIPSQPANRATSNSSPPRSATNSPGFGPKTMSRPVLECGGRAGFYACGRNSTECCAVTQDNPCFSGAYSCKLDASQGGANMVCCLK